MGGIILNELYDAVIIGGGPAGLTAAIYLSRAKYRVIVVEKDRFGGQITITSEVVNYPGVEKTSGKALTESMRKQAENFGAEFKAAEVASIENKDKIMIVKTSKGELKCYGILLATGASPRMIGFTGEAEFRGKGVAYCATCDGEFFTGKPVYVIGGGFAAAEESVFLTKYASHVTILIRGDDFTCAKATADVARQNEKITVLTNTSVVSVSGDSALKKLIYKNNKTGEETVVKAPDGEAFGVFVFAGYQPETKLLEGIAEINEQGYVITDKAQKTTADGIYAAGDVCIKPLRQVVTAVGDGALAATELEKYISVMQKEIGIIPKKPVMKKIEATEETKETSSPKDSSSLFDKDMLSQLGAVFSKMENQLILKLFLDDSELSSELQSYTKELAKLTDKLTVEIGEKEEYLPCVKVFKKDGEFTGLAFHGVPGGHEFTSFVLGLYNASGSGQQVEKGDEAEIKSIDKTIKMQVLVSLSCTMCPDLVVAAQKIATLNNNVTAEVYDLNNFKELRDKYNVMSVPCLVINDGEKISFGKKNIKELLKIIK